LLAPLLNAATAVGSTSQAIDCSAYAYLTVYLIGTGTISGGTLTIEEAHLTDGVYNGTWSEIGTIAAADTSGGKQVAYHIGGPGGAFAYSAVRVRLTDAVTGGGSITAVLRGL
jgi:hypothetical protein